MRKIAYKQIKCILIKMEQPLKTLANDVEDNSELYTSMMLSNPYMIQKSYGDRFKTKRLIRHRSDNSSRDPSISWFFIQAEQSDEKKNIDPE